MAKNYGFKAKKTLSQQELFDKINKKYEVELNAMQERYQLEMDNFGSLTEETQKDMNVLIGKIKKEGLDS